MANTKETFGDKATLAGLVGNTLTEFEEDSVPELRELAFYGRTALQSVKMPGTTRIKNSCFYGCTGLTEIGENDFPDLTYIGSEAFRNCLNLRSVTFKKIETVDASAFYGCTNLSHVEFLSETEMPAFGSSAFNGAKELREVIIRYVSENGPGALSTTSVFSGTKLYVGKGAIYVPSSMVEKYRAATNWSAFRIESIDDYPLANFDTIQDSWAQIAAAEANGTYKSKYSVGDTKSVEITVDGTTYDLTMKIIAMDEDTLSDGSGKAKITWGADLLPMVRRMNPTGHLTDNWENSGIRAFLSSDVLTALESAFGSDIAIQSVKKKYYDYGTSSVKTCDDKVFIPSLGELKYSGQSSSFLDATEPDSPDYTGAFGGKGLGTNGSAQWYAKRSVSSYNADSWWVRSMIDRQSYGYVNGNGVASNATTDNGLHILPCFCT